MAIQYESTPPPAAPGDDPVGQETILDGENDHFNAGAGDDTVSAGSGKDYVGGGDGEDVLYGGEGNDTLSGNADDDDLFGDNGNDKLRGGDGDDYLNGGANDDLLIGNAGSDTLEGGVGNDTLHGGAGGDVLIGGEGEDVFLFKLVADNASDRPSDLIVDMTIGEDVIDFDDFTLDGNAYTVLDIYEDSGDLIFEFGKTVNDKYKGELVVQGLGADFLAAADQGAFINSLMSVEDQQFDTFFI